MNKVIEERTKRTEWYRDARFGMFIHWGLYSIPACGEWMMSEKEMKMEAISMLWEKKTETYVSLRKR